MPQDMTCPKCTTVFPVTQARHPVGVDCPKCETGLTVEFRKPATPPPAGQPPFEMVVKTGKPTAAQDAPPSKKRAKDDDEDGKKQKAGATPWVVILVAGLGLLLVTGGLGATGYFLFTNLDPPTVGARPNNNNNNNNPRPNNPNPGGGNKGGDPASNMEFISTDAKFAIRFPGGRPIEQQQPNPAGGGSTRSFVLPPKSQTDPTYMVAVVDVQGVNAKTPQAQIDAQLNLARDGLVQSFNGKLTNNSKFVFASGNQKHSGREFIATMTQPLNGEVWGRLILAGNRLYMITILGPNKTATGAEAKAFMSSFRLVD